MEPKNMKYAIIATMVGLLMVSCQQQQQQQEQSNNNTTAVIPTVNTDKK